MYVELKKVFLTGASCVMMGGAAHAQSVGQPTPAPAGAAIDATSTAQATASAQATGTTAGPVAETSAAAAAAPVSSDRVGEIIVTAQKRSTNLQKLPATISVVSGAALKQLEIRSLSQLNTVVPGYNFEKSPGGNQVIAVRGVGTSSSAQSLEQSVASYINGVYMGGNLREFGTPLYDIGQVEVLKGTQSGISGQNTSVGALNIVTVMPGNRFGGYVEGGHEFNFHGWNAEGAVDLPVSDTLKLRVSGLYDKVGNYVYNVTTKTHTGGSKNYSGRLNADWRAGAGVGVKLYAQYDKGDALNNALIPIRTPGALYSLFIPGLTPDGSTAADYGVRGEKGGNDFYHYNNLRGSITVNVDVGRATLTSVTAASRIHDRFGVDGDVSPLDISWLAQTSRYSQIHQEVRLVSPSNDRLTYILGAWYRHSKQDKTIDFFVDPPVPPPAPAPHFLAEIPFLQKTDTASMFGDLHYKITPQFVVGGTLRYTNETKKGQIAVVDPLNIFVGIPGSFSPYPLTRGKLHPSFLDGSATVQYSPSDTTMFYALYAHGTKTGAFIDLQPTLLALRPEKTNTFEVGTKLRFPDAHLTFNLSAFRMNVKDFQDVYAVRGAGTTFFAATNRDLHTQGVEFQSDWRPVQGLHLGVAGTLLGSKDQAGGRSAYAPKFTIAGNARYETPVSADWKAAVFGNVYHTSSYLNNVNQPDPELTATRGYTMVDLGVTAFQDKGLSAKFTVKNVGNTHAYTLVDSNPVDPTQLNGALLPLRRYVLSFGYNF